MSMKLSLQKLNPDWEKAKKHALANSTGKIKTPNTLSSSRAATNQQITCECCDEYLSKEPVNLLAHPKQLQFLGFGFPMFYQFLKYCIILLIINVGCYNALSLQKAVYNNYEFCHHSSDLPHSNLQAQQHPKVCYTFFIQLARIQQNQSGQQLTMRCVAFGIQLLALLFIRSTLIKLQCYYEQRSTTLSNYSIVIKGIKLKEGIRKKTVQLLEQQFKDCQINIQQIIPLPQFSNIQQLKLQRNKVTDKLRPFYDEKFKDQSEIQIASHLQNNQQIKKLNCQINQIDQKLIGFANDALQMIKQDKLPCQRVIVVFNTEQQKNNVLNKFQRMDRQITYKYFGENSRIKMNKARNPQQIIWKNVNITKREKIIKLIIGWFLSLLLLVTIFIIFFFVLVEKSQLMQQSLNNLSKDPQNPQYRTSYNGAVAITFLQMFLVVLFGKLVLSNLFHKFTEMQKHKSISGLQFSFALKLSLGLFFTTALMTLAVQAIKFQNYMSHPYGVIDQQSIMFFMNSFFIPIFWLINPLRLFKKITRKLKYGKKGLTQQQANKIMEQVDYDIGKRFAQVIQTMWFAYLYSTLIPLGGVVVIVGLGLYYWVDKYNLLRRSKVNGKIDGRFIHTSMTLLDFTLILKPVGSLIFDYHLRGRSYLSSSIIMIVIAFIYIIFPKNNLIRIFTQQFYHPKQKTYCEVKNRFQKIFNTEHPLFSLLASQDSKANRLAIQKRFETLHSYDSSTRIRIQQTIN